MSPAINGYKLLKCIKKGPKKYFKSAPNVPKSTIEIPQSTHKKKYKPNNVFLKSFWPR